MWTKLPLACFVLVFLSGCAKESRAIVVERSLISSRGTNYYVVVPGDSLYSIAWRFDTQAKLLAEYNGIDPPYVIQPGWRLALKQKNSHARVRKNSPTATKESPNGADTVGKPSATTVVQNYTGVWRWPVEAVVTRPFGSGNKGIDYMLARGQMIRATAQGSVVYTGPGLGGYRNLVIVKHDSSYLSAYGMNTDYLVAEGDAVGPDRGIARVLSSANDGGKFHFEVRREGKPVNPDQLVSTR